MNPVIVGRDTAAEAAALASATAVARGEEVARAHGLAPAAC
jgi:hypothetical protein